MVHHGYDISVLILHAAWMMMIRRHPPLFINCYVNILRTQADRRVAPMWPQ